MLAALLAGCVPLKKITKPITFPITTVVGTMGAVGTALLPPYASPKARVNVVDFENQASKAGNALSPQLRRDLINALINSNRFSIIEPNVKNPDLIIAAVIAEYEPQIQGGSAGVGGGGSAANGAWGGLLGISSNKAHLALDIRIVKAGSSEILATNRIKAQGLDIDKAIRICINDVVRYIASAIPATYYKYYK